jgi:hypothetical protein
MSDAERRLKPITAAGVAAALQKAHRYRVLNDPTAAESICLDVLAVDPGNAEALVMHLLAITDQFASGAGAADLARAEEAAARLDDAYRNAYYSGIVCERWAKAMLQRAAPRAHQMAHDWLAQALAHYELAEAQRPPGNDEAILRWNTCVRLMQRDTRIRPAEAEAWEPGLELE